IQASPQARREVSRRKGRVARAAVERWSRHPAACLCRRGRLRARRGAACRSQRELPHRAVGWAWVTLMVIVAGSSFWIHELRVWGPWSPIHLLAIYTLAMLPLAAMHARRHRVEKHRKAMIAIFVGALVVAGLFTFWPGRIMHAVLFGQ